MSQVLPLFILFPLVAGLIVWLAGRLNHWLANILAVLSSLCLAVGVIALYSVRPFNNLIIQPGGSFVLDGLSHLILLIANVSALIIVIYSTAYFSKEKNAGKFFGLFFVMLAGINGTVLAGHLLIMFIFLEVAALSAYALVAFGGERKELEAATKYFILGEIASILILFAIGILFSQAETFNLAALARELPKGAVQLKMLALWLFIVGCGMKAALIPFHFWLPDAHTAAPSPVSAILSGVIVKALGIYILVRIIFNVIGMTPQIAAALTVLGVFSILIGGLMALRQNDMKRLFAYSTVSQVGYIVLGICLATPMGLLGGLFHLFNHAFMKSLLFLNAGAVEKATGTRDLRELGGLREKMPATALSFLVGALAISGMPPFNGFWSKLFIIIACVQAGKLWFALAAVIGSILTMGAVLKIQKAVFFSSVKENLAAVKEAPLMMNVAMIILVLVCLGVGLAFPFILSLVINPAVVALANGTCYGQMLLGGQ
jgi:multicomponent Na+:H+ antiporter subunit D